MKWTSLTGLLRKLGMSFVHFMHLVPEDAGSNLYSLELEDRHSLYVEADVMISEDAWKMESMQAESFPRL